LLNFYKKTYRIIGCSILLIGLLCIPFLPSLINGSYPSDVNLTCLYLVYLFNAVISYFLFAYLNSILVAYQRNDVISLINTIVTVALNCFQIFVVISTKNYILFSILLPISTIVNNIMMFVSVKRRFPQYCCEGTITSNEKKSIKQLVFGAFLQKASGVTRNAFDSMCTSAFLGLTLTAIYNNYFLIMNAVTVFISVLYTSVVGGVGNHVATKDKEKNYTEMKHIDFLYLWISGWCATCLLCLYQPFMSLWMGRDMMLEMPIVVLFCVYFYLLKLGDIRCIYAEANGLWWKHKYRAIVELIMNIVLNIFLGKLFGIYGIILATIITLVLCNYLWGTVITFENYFGKEYIIGYFKYQAIFSIVIAIVCIITYLLCSIIDIDSSIITIIVRFVICCIVPNIIFMLVFKNNSDFYYLKKKLIE